MNYTTSVNKILGTDTRQQFEKSVEILFDKIQIVDLSIIRDGNRAKKNNIFVCQKGSCDGFILKINFK